MFIPIVNVDGASFVEDNWRASKKILNKRKNMNPKFSGMCGDEDAGTDLNRNWGTDWKVADDKDLHTVCGDYWPGDTAFSEPESKHLRDFIASNKQQLKFVINCHTSGN